MSSGDGVLVVGPWENSTLDDAAANSVGKTEIVVASTEGKVQETHYDNHGELLLFIQDCDSDGEPLPGKLCIKGFDSMRSADEYLTYRCERAHPGAQVWLLPQPVARLTVANKVALVQA